MESGELPLGWYLRAVGRSWVLVVLIVLIAAGAAAGYSLSRDPVYRAEMALVVGQGSGLLDPAALGQSPEPFTQTVSGLLTSDVVARRVIGIVEGEPASGERSLIPLDTIGGEQPGGEQASGEQGGLIPDQLLSRLEVETEPQSTVLNVSYDSTSRREARAVLDGIARGFDDVLQESFPSGGAAGSRRITVTVFDPPQLLSEPVSPHPIRNTGVAGVLGLLLGLAIAIGRASLERSGTRRMSASDAEPRASDA